MRFSDYLNQEWRPALGCTEPACIAHAAATAASRLGGEIRSVHLVCDPRIYKNCFAVGIPNSEGRSGILWALALGACTAAPERKLEIFSSVDADAIARAGALLETSAISVDVDSGHKGLWVDCRIQTSSGNARAVIAGEHTNLVRLEVNSVPEIERSQEEDGVGGRGVRARLAAMDFAQMLDLACELAAEERDRLAAGIELNMAIAEHGAGMFPDGFLSADADFQTRVSHLVCGGVHARMSGEEFTVMTLAGSGNKGIVVAVPMALWADNLGVGHAERDRALAVACLLTSAATAHLGTLSAMCGSANAAGIGLAAGRVVLAGGGAKEISRAVTNMVGNLTGMICDGAKIGCGLKVMTGVDAAHRAASLALAGVEIPFSDGIVGGDGLASLANLGRIALRGMVTTDTEILHIMGEKLEQPGP